jgi:hypothetical protein
MTDTMTPRNIDFSSWDTLYSSRNKRRGGFKKIIEKIKNLSKYKHIKSIINFPQFGKLEISNEIYQTWRSLLNKKFWLLKLCTLIEAAP